MLRLLYKTILISTLSFSLMLLNFSYSDHLVQYNAAKAEEVKQEAAGESMGVGSILSTLTMVAVGLLATKLYNYKMTTDIMLAAAGGAAFIGGDVAAFFKEKSAIKELTTQITRDTDGNVDQKQISTLQSLKKSNETAKDTSDIKLALQMAGSAAFIAAAGTAFAVGTMEETATQLCQQGIMNAQSTAHAEVLSKCTSMDIKATTSCNLVPAACAAAGAGCIEAQRQCMQDQIDAQECRTELQACSAKISKDKILLTKFMTTREPPGPSTCIFHEFLIFV